MRITAQPSFPAPKYQMSFEEFDSEAGMWLSDVCYFNDIVDAQDSAQDQESSCSSLIRNINIVELADPQPLSF